MYTIGRTWSWPVMSAAACTLIISHQKCRHPIPSPPSPSTVRSRDHTVLYCTIVLYSTKKEKICLQTSKEQTDVSKTESTLILSGSSPDTRGSWPIENMSKMLYLYNTISVFIIVNRNNGINLPQKV